MPVTKSISVDARGDRNQDSDDGWPDFPHGDVGEQLIGPTCAKRLGLEWSREDARDTGDAECTVCGAMFHSADGPNFNLAVCGGCFGQAGAGPLAVVEGIR